MNECYHARVRATNPHTLRAKSNEIREWHCHSSTGPHLVKYPPPHRILLPPHPLLVCCSVLQCVAVCCSVLQSVAVCCRVLLCVAVCVAVCCSVLQCVAEYCSVLQCVTVCGNVLQESERLVLIVHTCAKKVQRERVGMRGGSRER